MQTPPFNGKILKERVAVFKPPYTITGVYCFGPVTINQYKQTRTQTVNRQRDLEFYLLASQQTLYI